MEINFLHLERNYDLESLKYSVKLLPADDHPLLHQGPAPEAPQPQKQEDIKEIEENKVDPWSRFKEEIQKHSEQHIGADENIELIENSTESTLLEIRLGELENSEKRQILETLTITKSEYKKQMQILYELMPKLWAEQRKVDCLKVVIQCAKLLNNIESAQFYPEKFIAICDIFDLFGKLVFQRIKQVSGSSRFDNIPDTSIRPEMVPEQAKEICNNWFLKTSIIREVLPRCFVEICLAKCYFFISEDPIRVTLERIAKAIRGVSEPLAAIHLSVYLARVGVGIDPKEKSYLLLLLDNVYNILYLAEKRGFPGIDVEDYLSCYDMAIHWLICSICENASQAVYEKVLKVYQFHPPKEKILKHIVIYSSEENIAVDGPRLFELARALDKTGQITVLTELAKKFVVVPPQLKRMRLEFMNYTWTLAKDITDGELYMGLVTALTEFAIKYLKVEKVDFLQEIFQKCKAFLIGSEAVQLKLCESLEKLLLKVLGTSSSLTEVLSIDSLVPLFDYFAGNIKKKLCGMILNTVLNNAGVIADTVTAHTILGLGKIVHDTVDFLASEEEVETVGKTLREVIRKIDFGRDLEQQLKVLTQARGIFINFDQIQKALQCSENCLRLMKYRHTRKSLGFSKMCISFAVITIPSLKDPQSQLNNYITALQCALANNLISETDSLFRAALKLIKTLLESPETESLMERPLNLLIGFSIMVPGDPTVSGFKLLEETFEVLLEHRWGENVKHMKIRILLNFLACVVALLQNKLPYHAFKVDANDAIFINDEIYLSTGKSLIQRAVQEICEIINESDKTIEKGEDVKKYYTACLKAANVLMAHTKPNQTGVKIIQKLITLADKYQKMEPENDPEYFKNTMNYYNKRFR